MDCALAVPEHSALQLFDRAFGDSSMRLLRLLTAFLALVALSGCAVSRTHHWQEEVLLHDGRVIVVERSVRTGEVPVELGQPPGESDYTLTFQAPDGKTITWESGKSFRPMILDFEGATPHVIALGSTGPDYEKHGCPKPPYFIFRWSSDRWQRIEYDQLPRSIRMANLTLSATRGGKLREAISQGRTTVEDVKQSHRWLSSHYKEIKENAPNPCANRRDDVKYVPPKKS
jgi:hypothetical protein